MSEYLDWKIGDEVVCVDTSTDPRGNKAETQMNEIYKIKALSLEYSYYSNKETLLIELLECGGRYDAHRFRKVQKHKTDISIFKSMLNKSPEENNKELVESQVKDMIDA